MHACYSKIHLIHLYKHMRLPAAVAVVDDDVAAVDAADDPLELVGPLLPK